METEPKQEQQTNIELIIKDRINQTEAKDLEKNAVLHTLLENIENGKISKDDAKIVLETL